MIAFVNGRVAGLAPDAAVVEVGGVGLSLQCTPGTLARLRVGETAHVATSLVVREDSLTLFGFADDDERNVFELVQTASGVGPRVALAMLAVHTPNTLRRIMATEDVAGLTQVPGIGKKGAAKILLELKDRLGAAYDDGADRVVPVQSGGGPAWRPQVHTALTNLGWSAKDADAAVQAVAGEAGEQPDVAALLRSALRKLSRA